MDATLKRGIDAVWSVDANDAETRVKRAAALFLLEQPEWAAKSTSVGGAVRLASGIVSSLGIKTPFRKIFQDDPFFITEQDPLIASECSIALHPAALNPMAAMNAAWAADAADPYARLKRSAAMVLYASGSSQTAIAILAAAVRLDVGPPSKLGII
jgi:hypothetical protein